MAAAPDKTLLSHTPRAGSALRRWTRLMIKEQREILRDRRTIVTLVLMPLLLYPLLAVAFQQFFLASMPTGKAPLYYVGVSSVPEGAFVTHYLSLGEPADVAKSTSDEAKPPEPMIKLMLVDDVTDQVLGSALDLGIRFRQPPPSQIDPRQNLAVDWDLVVREGSATGRNALQHVIERLRKANQRFLEARLKTLGVSQRPDPVRAYEAPLASPETAPTSVTLAAVAPLILILLTIAGAVYPAIDLTAGERERGTLEILVAAPVPRLGLLLAKYSAVLTVAILTAAINLVTMSVTLFSTGLAPILFGPDGLTVTVAMQVFVLLLLFAAFFSAVLLVLCSFARSFKEAQAYLVPLMLFSLGPGMASLMPGLKLSGLTPVIPLVNIVLLSRDLFEQAADPASAAVVVISTLFYAALAISIAARIFGAEAVLYGEQGNWSDLFRRPPQTSAAPTLTAALLCLALLFPAYVLLSNAVARFGGASIGARWAAAAFVTALLFGGFPLVALYMGRVRLRSGLRAHRFGWAALPAAVVLGLSLWPFTHEIVLLTRKLGLVTIGPEQLEQAKDLLEQVRALPVAWVLLVFAVIPAVFEETFFRGFLFSALRAQSNASSAIVWSSFLFALFHLVAQDALTFERFLPSLLLGVVLGWVAWRAGSVFPGMALHACHNGFVITVTYYQESLARMGWGIEEQSHIPAAWLATAGVAVAIGLALLWFFCKPNGEGASVTSQADV